MGVKTKQGVSGSRIRQASAARPDALTKGSTVGVLTLVRQLGGQRLECRCECGRVVTRPAHTLLYALRRGHRSSCATCNATRARGTWDSKRTRLALESMTAEQRARVLKLTRGRTDDETMSEAVSMVLKDQDVMAGGSPERPDPFRCDYKHRYHGAG